jgi:HEAT repeat protein
MWSAMLRQCAGHFRRAVRASMPQIIALLSDSDASVRQQSVDTLSKISEEGKISHLCFAKSLMSLVAELRESIGPAIPQLIPLLSDSNWDVCTAGANALSKMSEQGRMSHFLL